MLDQGVQSPGEISREARRDIRAKLNKSWRPKGVERGRKGGLQPSTLKWDISPVRQS